MSYQTCYTLPFKGLDGRDYTVRIEREGYTGDAVELKGQSSPFTVAIDDEEFVYSPTRFSTGTLHIFGGDYLQDLFSTDYRMHRVTLLHTQAVPVWCGFIRPEVYTQDYRNVRFALDLECMSAMSVLEHVDYRQQGETRGTISLMDLIRLCVLESRGDYSAIYLPHVYGSTAESFTTWDNPLEQMTVSEQNFFDEDDKPMTLKEVLEEVMKLMNWTCADWQGALYFVDIDNETGEYYRYYNKELKNYEKVSADSTRVQDIGFSGSDHTLDIVPGYNKATVRCSNYPVDGTLPEVDFDKMKKTGETTLGIPGEPDKRKHIVGKRTMEGSKFTALRYEYNHTEGTLRELSPDEEKQKDYTDEEGVWHYFTEVGALPRQTETLDYKDGQPIQTEHSYTDEIHIPLAEHDNSGQKFGVAYFGGKGEVPVMRMKGIVSNYKSGGFGINFQLQTEFLTNPYNGETLVGYDFHFQLRIGKWYYHGKQDGSYKWDNSPKQDTEYPNNLEVDWQEESLTPGKLTQFKGTYNLFSSRKLDDGFEGVKGFICRIPEDRILSGDMELTLFAPTLKANIMRSFANVTLTGLELKYSPPSDNGTSDSGDDRTYENVVNESYINELDEIEMKISSYNNDGACYSKVMLGNDYLTDNLYCSIIGATIRPEEFLIRRIVDHYSATKIKLTQVLKRANIQPFTILTDRHQPDRQFLAMGGEIDYKKNSFTCIMIEI